MPGVQVIYHLIHFGILVVNGAVVCYLSHLILSFKVKSKKVEIVIGMLLCSVQSFDTLDI